MSKKPPSKTRAKGFGTTTDESTEDTQVNNELFLQYRMFMDMLYNLGLQHCLISDLAYELAELKGIPAEELMQSVAANVSLDRLTTYMTDNSEYPTEECQAYIQYKADMYRELDKLDTGEVKE